MMHMYCPVFVCTIGCSCLLSRGAGGASAVAADAAAAPTLLLQLQDGPASIDRVLINILRDLVDANEASERTRGLIAQAICRLGGP